MAEKLNSNDQLELLGDFIENVIDAPRINTAHISLYES